MLLEHKFGIFDVETGGLNPDKNPVCEIGIVIMDNNFDIIEKYGNLVKNYDAKTYTPRAMQVNGITLEQIARDGITVQQMVKEVQELFKKHSHGRSKKICLVGHNVEFDMGFLVSAFAFCKRDLFESIDDHPIDTKWLARFMLGHEEQENFKLPTVCKTLGVELTDAHRAVNDAEATAEAFKKMVLSMRGNVTVGAVDKREKQRSEFRF